MAYKDFIESVKAQRGGNFSKSSLVDLAVEMFNEPDCTVDVYSKKGDSYVVTTMAPGKKLRSDFVAPILKMFGVDKAELPKLDSIQISRAAGEAIADFSTLLVKEYISMNGMGRRLTLPMTSLEDTAATIGMQEVPEKEEKTTKIVKNSAGDGYVVEPTGKIVTTLKHNKLIGKNKTQPWHKRSRAV